jgi:hypothetical protein
VSKFLRCRNEAVVENAATKTDEEDDGDTFNETIGL